MVVDDYTRPANRRMMTFDLRALYPHDIEDQAVLRPVTRKQVRRAERLGFRTWPRTVASRSHPRPFRSGPKDGRLLEPETGVDTMEQTRQTLEIAAAQVAARLQDSRRARARQCTAPDRSPPATQQPGTQHTPGRTT